MTMPSRTATARDLAETAIVLMAIFFALGTFSAFETLIFALGSAAWPEGEPGSRALEISLAIIALRYGVAAVLIVARSAISKKLIPQANLPGIDRVGLHAMVLSALGAYLFVLSVTRVITSLSLAAKSDELFPALVLTLLGLGLFLGARGIADAWANLGSRS